MPFYINLLYVSPKPFSYPNFFLFRIFSLPNFFLFRILGGTWLRTQDRLENTSPPTNRLSYPSILTTSFCLIHTYRMGRVLCVCLFHHWLCHLLRIPSARGWLCGRWMWMLPTRMQPMPTVRLRTHVTLWCVMQPMLLNFPLKDDPAVSKIATID